MVRPLGERPGFPSPPRGLPVAITGWASDMVKVLTGLLTETNVAVNALIKGGGTVDYMLEIAKGNVTGTLGINKFGRNTSVTDGNTEEVWDGSAAYVWPATALMTKISQTTDQATMRGEDVQIEGLDASWDYVVQTATLNGSDTVTAVTLATPLIRCFRMEVQADVVTTSPIRVHNTGESQDYAIIGTGNNQTLMAIYTVPNGKTAYMTQFYAVAHPGSGAPTKLDVKLWAKDNANSYEKKLKHVLGVAADVDAYGFLPVQFRPYKKFTQKTDIYVSASPTGAAVDISAGFDLIVVDN